MVLRLCDELDKAKDINDYFKKILLQYINERINPQLLKLQDETLVKEFTKQWQNYTILVNFMKKMFSYLVRYLSNSDTVPYRTGTT
jgi:hypothetical protein